jgi:hypothetical protein
MSVVTFGPIVPNEQGKLEAKHGFDPEEIPELFAHEAREFLKKNRRGTHQFLKPAFVSWIKSPARAIVFNQAAHINKLYKYLTDQIKEADQREKSEYPDRMPEIYECLISVINEINENWRISPQEVMNVIRREIEMHGDKTKLGPYPVDFNELQFVIWAWNTNYFSDEIQSGTKEMLKKGYAILEDMHHDLVYPFGTRNQAWEAISEVYEDTGDAFLLNNAEELSKYFVKVDPPRLAYEFFETPYDLVKNRDRLRLIPSAPPPPPARQARPPPLPDRPAPAPAPPHAADGGVDDTEKNEDAKKKRKTMADWMWSKDTQKYALAWAAKRIEPGEKTINKRHFQDFVDACMVANPNWVNLGVHKKTACEQLFVNVNRKFYNDFNNKKRLEEKKAAKQLADLNLAPERVAL